MIPRRLIEPVIRLLAARYGYQIVRQGPLVVSAFADHLRRLLDSLGIDAVIDVGANRGQYYDFLRKRVGFSGLVVSIEPIAECATYLRDRATGNSDWLIIEAALGDERGYRPFNVMCETQFSSFLAPDHSRVRGFEEGNRISRIVEVQVRRLDELLETEGRLRNSAAVYLKLDTQGHDLAVIRGGTRSLTRVRALQTEVSLMPIYRGMPQLQDTLTALESLGFDPSGFFPNNPEHFPRLLEVDAVFVKRNAPGGPC